MYTNTNTSQIILHEEIWSHWTIWIFFNLHNLISFPIFNLIHIPKFFIFQKYALNELTNEERPRTKFEFFALKYD